MASRPTLASIRPNPFKLNLLLGMSEDEAPRRVEADGYVRRARPEGGVFTLDFQPKRITAFLDDNGDVIDAFGPS